MWCKYSNISGTSGIDSYQILPDENVIQIRFKRSNGTYSYSASKIGETKYNNMVLYAKRGKGLNTFINKNQDVKKSSVKS